MRKLKLFLPIIAVLIAVAGVFAMKANKVSVMESPLSVGYYEFVGTDPSNALQRVDETNYQYIDATGPTENDPCYNGAEVLCGVKTQGDGIHPSIGTSGTVYNALYTDSQEPGLTYHHDE